MKEIKYAGAVSSKIGFYVGDICYALSDTMYHGIWGDKHHYDDGQFEMMDSGCSFAVARTAYGDGCYGDQAGREYPVDAGVIGIVPLELVAKPKAEYLGTIVACPGVALYEMQNGVFDFTLPDGENIHIDTHYEDDDEEDDEEEWEDDEYDEDDDDWEDEEDE